ncbi:hypothetical protein PVAND_010372 [Polypedilum vanderplanki]|uniref:Uncharacterized protein n=1 Tax=Polypedilum vanderplanki TaxID=319348 RepID=A0A9J6CG21_POLVA|nr:hypothetical protein PVAND_010372 [Polypedilum vanderplanki]
MLYKNICGLNLNLIKVALFIGTYDIFGTITLIFIEFEFFKQMQTQQMIYLSCFSIGIMAAILLIHGALKLNRQLLLYWLSVAVLRIVLQSLIILEIFYYHILDNTTSYEILYSTLEILDYVVLITSFCLVISLYKQLKYRDGNFTRFENEV